METGIQLGVMLWCHTLSDLQRKAGLAAAAGYRYCQVTFLWAVTTGEAVVAADTALQQGVEIVAFGAYANLLRPGEETFGGTRLQTVYDLIEALHTVGCRRIALWSGSYGRHVEDAVPANWTPQARAVALAEARSLATRLRSHAGYLCLEPFHTHVLRTAAEYAAFARAVDDDVGRVVLDPPNLIPAAEYDRLPERLPAIVQTLAPVTGLIHLKDLSRRADGSLARPGPGHGTIDYAHFLSLIAAHGIAAPAIIESVDDTSVTEMRDARRFVEQHAQSAGLRLA
ncbi:MAG: sugar phosphate isomerase/epimerase [Armatimonadetes bacterium]|jgi:sugar phosphate isomerase/epimerase|nr:sugar phosphate isomerase/epimerase [Armatimonadota bacterium]